MSFLKRALPFFLTFILGVMLGGIPVRKCSKSDFYYYAPDKLTQPVVVQSLPDASYTEEARRNRFEGVISLYVLCDANGTVSDVRLEDSLPYGLTEEAIRAARGIRFIPAANNGRQVSVWMPVKYSFESWQDNVFTTGFAFMPEVRPERWTLQH